MTAEIQIEYGRTHCFSGNGGATNPIWARIRSLKIPCGRDRMNVTYVRRHIKICVLANHRQSFPHARAPMRCRNKFALPQSGGKDLPAGYGEAPAHDCVGGRRPSRLTHARGQQRLRQRVRQTETCAERHWYRAALSRQSRRDIDPQRRRGRTTRTRPATVASM
jgi:hypothetical protein